MRLLGADCPVDRSAVLSSSNPIWPYNIKNSKREHKQLGQITKLISQPAYAVAWSHDTSERSHDNSDIMTPFMQETSKDAASVGLAAKSFHLAGVNNVLLVEQCDQLFPIYS